MSSMDTWRVKCRGASSLVLVSVPVLALALAFVPRRGSVPGARGLFSLRMGVCCRMAGPFFLHWAWLPTGLALAAYSAPSLRKSSTWLPCPFLAKPKAG